MAVSKDLQVRMSGGGTKSIVEGQTLLSFLALLKVLRARHSQAKLGSLQVGGRRQGKEIEMESKCHYVNCESPVQVFCGFQLKMQRENKCRVMLTNVPSKGEGYGVYNGLWPIALL